MNYSVTFGGVPSIESVWPPAGQRGSEFELKIVGSGLTNAQQLMFYSPSLRCKSLRVKSDYEVHATVECDKNGSIGNEPFRLLGKEGFSELRTLRITPLPIVLAERGEKSSEPYPIQVPNATLCGTLEAGEFDRYSIRLKGGQRISVEVDAVRLGAELLDTVLTILDANGRILQKADDSSLHHQDPTLSFQASEDGEYLIDVHESNYQGSEQSYYALHVGEFPAAKVVYPAGGQIGTTVPLRYLGEVDERASAEIPKIEKERGSFQLLRSRNGVVAPSAVPFRCSTAENYLESEPNDKPDSLRSPQNIPIAFNGILQEEGDVDYFAFEVDSEQPIRIEGFAQSIGSSADTRIAILDRQLQTLASNDDWGSHDSRIDFHPPEAGAYFLRVSDKLSKGARDAVYRIEVSRLQPKVVPFLPRPDRLSKQNQAIAVPQGNRVLVRLGVQRELVDADVQLRFVDLPDGVHVATSVIPSDQFWIPMVVEADSSMAVSGHYAGLEAKCQVNGEEVRGHFEQVVDLVAESADQLFQSSKVDRIPIAITPSMPFTIDLQQPTTSLAIDGTIDLVVSVQRQKGFEEPVRVELPFLPPWVVAEPFVVIPADQERVTYPIEARQQAAARTWPIVASARVDTVSAKGDTKELDGREVASGMVELKIESSPFSGEMKGLAAEQGETIKVSCHLKRSKEASTSPTSLQATLEGLPNRVTSSPVTIDAEQTRIDFELVVANDAPIGRFNSLQCRLVGESKGQSVSFVVSTNSELQIAAPGKILRGANGSLLSPLEALRRTNSNPILEKPN